MAAKKVTMPTECCGGCRFAFDVRGQDYLLCMAQPPIALRTDDDEIEWLRGGAVEPTDPRCWFFVPKSIS